MSEHFSGKQWKIWAGVTVGIVVVGILFYLNLNQTRFISVQDDSGSHCWTDQNHNGRIDLGLEKEFYLCDEGTYRKEHLSDVFYNIHWTGASIAFIVGAMLFMGLRDVFYMLRIRLLSDRGLSWRGSFQTIMLWEFASALSPGVMSGAAVAMFILNREKIPLSKSTTMVMVTAMLDNLFFCLMIPLVFMFYHSGQLFPVNSMAEYIFWAGYAVFLCVFIFFFLAVFIFPGLIPRLLLALFSLPILNRWKASIVKFATDLKYATKEMKTYRLLFWFKLTGATFGSWVSRFLVINCLLAAFVKLDGAGHLLILAKQFILWLFMRMSPTPGGSGVAEYAFSELMTTIGGSTLLVLALAFLWRILSYYSYLLIGSILLPRWLSKKP
jgi:uncharacterized protein (TIRG00374 family)